MTRMKPMARICVAEVLGCRYYCLWGGIVRTKESTMMVLTPAMVVGVREGWRGLLLEGWWIWGWSIQRTGYAITCEGKLGHNVGV